MAAYQFCDGHHVAMARASKYRLNEESRMQTLLNKILIEGIIRRYGVDTARVIHEMRRTYPKLDRLQICARQIYALVGALPDSKA